MQYVENILCVNYRKKISNEFFSKQHFLNSPDTFFKHLIFFYKILGNIPLKIYIHRNPFYRDNSLDLIAQKMSPRLECDFRDMNS